MGERIKRAREEKGLTQEELSVAVQWDVRRLRMVEGSEIPALPLFEVCELAVALEVTTFYLELGLQALKGAPIRDRMRKLQQSAMNFVMHCRDYALVRFERYLLWTKVMEASSHRNVVSPTAWRNHHVTILGSLQRPACVSKPAPVPAKRRITKKPRNQPCMCQDPVFRNRYSELLNCPFCGRDLDLEL